MSQGLFGRFLWFSRKVRWQFDKGLRGGGAKSLMPTDDKRSQPLYAFWFLLLCLMFKPSPSGVVNMRGTLLSCRSFLPLSNQQSAAGHVHQTHSEWWDNGLLVFVKPTWFVKVKGGRVLNQEQAGTLSPRSTKQLCRLRSQLRQVEYGLIKDRPNGNFTQFLQIRGYCFTNSWGFC